MMKLNNLLIKGFRRSSKLIYCIFSVSVICFSMLSFFVIGVYSYWREGVVDAKMRYGTYQFGIDNLNRETAEKVSDHKLLSDSTICYAQALTLEGLQAECLYVNENYLKMAGITLVKGNFPTNEQEILCEQWFLNDLGLQENDMLGAKIRLSGTDYRVSGIIIDHQSEDIIDCPYTTVLFSIKYLPIQTISDGFRVFCMTRSENYLPVQQAISSTLPAAFQDNVFENVKLQMYGKINSHGWPDSLDIRFALLVYLLIWIAAAGLLYTLITLWNHHIRPQAAIYISLGIQKKNILTAYYLLLLFTFSIAIIIVVGISSLFFIFRGASLRAGTVLLLTFLSNVLLIFCLLIWGSIPFIRFANRPLLTNLENAAGIRLPKKKRKSALKNSQCLSIHLALINLKTMRGRSFLFVLLLSVTILVFHTITYAMAAFSQIGAQPANYDYEFRPSHSDVLFISDEETPYHRFCTSLMENSHLASFPVFYQEIELMVPKNKLDKSTLRKLEKQDPHYSYVMENPSLETVSIPAVLIGATQEQLRFNYHLLDLPDNLQTEDGCIAPLSSLLTSGRIQFKWETGDHLSLKQYIGEEVIQKSLKIVHVTRADDYGSLKELRYSPIIFVSLQTFQEITGQNAPNMIYVTPLDASGASFIHTAENAGIMKMTDLQQENAAIHNQLSMVRMISLTVFSFLCLLIALNIMVSSLTRYEMMAGQYAMLQTIGIAKEKIRESFIFEILLITLCAFLIGGGLSIAVNYLLHHLLIQNYSYFKFSIPWPAYGLTSIILLAVSLLSFLPVFIRLKKDNISQRLSVAD